MIWGVSHYSPAVEQWFGFAAQVETTVGGFLFVLLASLATGVFVSGLRWATIDRVMRWTGTKRPALNEANWAEPDKLAAFSRANEDFYRYYQFYSNMIIASILTFGLSMNALGLLPWERPVITVLLVIGEIILFTSARNSLENYYRAAARIVGTTDD